MERISFSQLLFSKTNDRQAIPTNELKLLNFLRKLILNKFFYFFIDIYLIPLKQNQQKKAPSMA